MHVCIFYFGPHRSFLNNGIGVIFPSLLCFFGIFKQNLKDKYYSAVKRNKFESVLMRWMNLEPIIQSELRKRKTNIVY